MSVQAIAAVLDHSTATKGARLTAISFANHADKHGIAWPSLRSAGEEARLERRAVQEAIKKLRGVGELVLLVDADGRTHRPALHWIKLPGLAGTFAPEGGADRYFNAFGDELREEAEAVVAALDPGADSAPGGGAENAPGGASIATGALHKEKPSLNPWDGKTVNRKQVTEGEYELASAVIASFNSEAGTQLSVAPHLTPIVGRIRERPDLAAEHHRVLIEAVFAGECWWTDPPSPRIIYGNAAQFEQSLEIARAAQRKQRDEGDYDPNAELKRVRKEQGLD